MSSLNKSNPTQQLPDCPSTLWSVFLILQPTGNLTGPHQGRLCLRRLGWPWYHPSGLSGSSHSMRVYPCRWQRMLYPPEFAKASVSIVVLLCTRSAAQDHRLHPSRPPSTHLEASAASVYPHIHKSQCLVFEGRIAQPGRAQQGPPAEHNCRIAIQPLACLLNSAANWQSCWTSSE